MRHSPTCTPNEHGQCTCGSYYVETVESKLDQALTALAEIARLGVNATTVHGCVTRADFMRQGEKMWRVAFECVNALDKQAKEEKAMSYCSSLTNAQVENVLIAEKSRMERHPKGDVHDGAVELYHEAREELLRRGIEPDV